MDAPQITICLPTLNSLQFLEERLASIRLQACQAWELVVADSCSEDGSWELLKQFAAADPRTRMFQIKKEGVYPALNFCVAQATGKYVYFATSDDSMAPDCLEKLLAALERHPQCGLAHCSLRLVDPANGLGADWWRWASLFAASSGALLEQPHLRLAPHDGLLHLGGETLYTSLTQLLIRRSLFDKVGLFDPRWGSCGDFNWGMRAGLVTDVAHVADTWATWRLHPAQATAALDYDAARSILAFDEMVEQAVEGVGPLLEPAVRNRLQTEWRPYAAERRRFNGTLRGIQRRSQRAWFLLSSALAGRRSAVEALSDRFGGRPGWPHRFPGVVRGWLANLGQPPSLVPDR